MKKSWIFSALLLVILFTGCHSDTKKDASPSLLKLIPAKTAGFIHSKDFSDLAEKLNAHSFIAENESLPLFDFFREAYKPISEISSAKTGILTLSMVGRDEIAITLISESDQQAKDSIALEFKESFTYNGEEVKAYGYEGKDFYHVQVKNYRITGNSKLVVENMIRLAKENLEPNPNLKRIFNSGTAKKNTLYLNFPELLHVYQASTPQNKSAIQEDFTNWMALDLAISPASLRLSGITLPEERDFLALLKETKPQKNELSLVTPISAIGTISFTFDDFSKVKDKLSFYRKEDYPEIDTDLFDAVSEMGQVFMTDGTAFVLKSKETEETTHWINVQGREKHKTHRGHDIFRFSKPGFFFQALQPLIKVQNLGFYAQVDNFYLFAGTETVLENLLSNYENGTVLAKSESYKKLEKKLDEKSTVLLTGSTPNLLKTLSKKVAENHTEAFERAKTLNYHHQAIQFINHDNFAYINGVFMDTQEASTSKSGVEIGRIKPGENFKNGPWYFINWRTKHYDIALQGESNTLYVFGENGQLRWKRQLDGPILGAPHTLDIYQNGRKQMAFVTPQTFYIIDREGNVVKPFNKTFKNTITQPLAVFDYNNNGRFRFIIVQDNHLTMLDKGLNTVKGFEFTTAKSKVLQTPKHFRFGNKDYLVIPEESGQLNILNPRGETRVAVNEKIDFSNNEWYVNNSLFTSTDKKGNLIQIDQQGHIKRKNLKLDERHKLAATGNTVVTFSGNKLTIKDKSSNLDYGQYTHPRIFYIGDKLYITITDAQNNKVYLFDSDSKLLPGFPVYGSAEADLQNRDAQGSLELIVKGEEDSLLIYEVK